MSGCCRTYNGACPTPVQSVTVNQTMLYLSDGSGIVDTYTDTDFSGTLVTLPFVPVAGYGVMVYVNGVLQTITEDYTITGANVTFQNELTADTVQIRYAAATSSITAIAQVFRYAAVHTGATVTLPRVPGTAIPMTVYVNGVLQVEGVGADQYTVSGATITFNTALGTPGLMVQVLYSS